MDYWDWIESLLTIHGILVFAATFLVAWLILRTLYQDRGVKLPPGPRPFPIIGNLPQLLVSGKDLYCTLNDYAAEYGPLVTVTIGNFRLVAVMGFDLVNEGLRMKGHSIAGRPNDIFLARRVFEKKGLFWSEGPRWHNSRKFTAVALRDFGVGKRTLEERIQDEANVIMKEIDMFKGKPFEPKMTFMNAASNIICSIVRGERYEYSDQEFKELMTAIDYFFQTASLILPENFLEWIVHLPFSKGKQILKMNDRLAAYMKRQIEEHAENFDSDNIRDFIDLYLKVKKEQPDSFLASEDNMFRVVLDLFVAGTETTATSLAWLLLHLITKPEIQERCTQEILKVVGPDRMVNLHDRESLHYLNATIHETQRLCNIAPIAAPHKVTETIELGGFVLPPGTVLLFHLQSAHMDAKQWSHPYEFDPDRWIGPDGKFVKNGAFMPFSVGPRACLGKPLAQMELFLFFANLLQRFKFSLPEGAPQPEMTGRQHGITLKPSPFNVCAWKL